MLPRKNYMNTPTITPRRILVGALSGLAFFALLICLPMLVENLDAKNLMVIQALGGDLNTFTEPGWKAQAFGKVTTYQRRDQFSFSSVKDQGKTTDESISTRFNDGGHGNISGTVNWQMPLKHEQIVALHKDFGSVGAIEQQLIRPAMQKVIYNVGPTMSSTESSAEKRPEIPKYIDDQLIHGPYLTKTVTVTQKDPITGADKQVAVVQIAMNDKGQPMRESESQITKYGIILQPVSINEIKYDQIVEDQIKQRQQSTTGVQISIANAKKAEQDAITTEQQGKATAAKAKWEQETLNAKEIAFAEKAVAVATLGAKAAEQYKKEQILRGEGDAQAKSLRMNADGALDAKLEAYVTVSKAYATAMGEYQGAWVPSVVMGNSAQGGNGAAALVEMLTAKTARELGIDMSVTKGKTSK
jgi:hypothetical protein